MTRTRAQASTAVSVTTIASALLAVAASSAGAQTGETFAASSHRETSPFKDVPPLYPECAGFVEQFDTMTDQLYALSDERRVSHSPRVDEIDREMLALENERGGVADRIRACRQASIEAKERARLAKLHGQVAEQAPLQGGIEKSTAATPPSAQPSKQESLPPFQLHAEDSRPAPATAGTPPLLPRTPELDTTPSASGAGGGSRQTSGDTSASVRPGTNGTTGAGGGSRTTTTSTSARIVSSNPPGTSGDGAAGSGDPQVELDVRAVLRSSTDEPDGPNGGTISNDFTRSYFFAQGVRDGLGKAAEETGGNAARIQIAAYYVMMGHPRKARDLLGFKMGQYVTIESLTKKIVEFFDAMTPKKDVSSVQQSYNVGVQTGKNLGGFLIDHYTGKVDGLDVPEALKIPDLTDSVPNKSNPKVPGEKPR
jgi:hypothetical protein